MSGPAPQAAAPSRGRLRAYLGTGAFAAFGAAIAGGGLSYTVGTVFSPGPGFFPLVIGCIIVFLAALTAIEAFAQGVEAADPVVEGDATARTSWAWRPLGAVVAGILAFVFLVDRAGYVPATFALVFLSALGESRQSFLRILGVAAFMAAFGVILFIWGLGLPMQAFGSR
ncbi:tripartite tricarboxylate transporter TctB family protein [Aureimonas populi]|uniref:Tripartite tricarboxylate transporter TctB family protein n=1 Tax=Aureimonas populi TaxID=1701758 RepID=A0ABW5CPW2_9HYPH|nr:tripartite tricarboxylate transporter TctB family protein [Aureimonas populi]